MLGFKMPLKCNQKAASSDGELLPSVPSVTPAQPQAAALEGSLATTEHQGLFILLPHHGKPGIQLLDSSQNMNTCSHGSFLSCIGSFTIINKTGNEIKLHFFSSCLKRLGNFTKKSHTRASFTCAQKYSAFPHQPQKEFFLTPHWRCKIKLCYLLWANPLALCYNPQLRGGMWPPEWLLGGWVSIIISPNAVLEDCTYPAA